MTKTKAAEIIARARELERFQRSQLIRKYANEGHLHVVEEKCLDELCISIEGHIFTDKRDNFPSIEFTAQVSLAIASGLSDRNEVPPLDRDVEEPQTPWRARNLDRALYRDGKQPGWYQP